MTSELLQRIDVAIANTSARLLALRNEHGHWEGELSSSALSTATAIIALHEVDAPANESFILQGAQWLLQHQNADGGWGDTTISKSNLSTTLLVWSALNLVDSEASAVARCEQWITKAVGSLQPDAIAKAVVERYGKDRTFSVPILMAMAIGSRLGANPWRRVLALPFELAVFPRAWFGAIGLPVVSYALPALIAIGHARFHHAPPPSWSPMRWLRRWAWTKVRPMLRDLQPSTGGYLEATPLTSFVTMALASAGEKEHPCVPHAVEFLHRSMRADGSWPIDTNLATWGTTLSVKALGDDLPHDDKQRIKSWLLNQQYQAVHPFTNAAPGGWAWTDLPGGVPDADDTAGTLIALWQLCDEGERQSIAMHASNGVRWLLDLQNRDGGMPTFCRGWGTLPFDRSAPELTAHALWAWHLWREHLPAELASRLPAAIERAHRYLRKTAREFGKLEGKRTFAHTSSAVRYVMPRRAPHWEPLWFGNELAADEVNPIYGTAMVLRGLLGSGLAADHSLVKIAGEFLFADQDAGGGWGGANGVQPSIEETAVALTAMAPIAPHFMGTHRRVSKPIVRAATWLLDTTKDGTEFPAAPIGLYFARLWYHERLYPILWTLGALKSARDFGERANA